MNTLNKTVIFSTFAAGLIGFSSGVLAASDSSRYEAMQSCLSKAKSELSLGNYDYIDRRAGAARVEHRTHEIYLNVIQGGNPDVMKRVKCVSAGFGKVQAFEVDDGQWAFIPAEATRQNRLAIVE